MLRSSGPFANGSLSDKREFGRIHHVIMNQSQALLHWQNQSRAVGRSRNLGGGYGFTVNIYKWKNIQVIEIPLSFQLPANTLAYIGISFSLYR